MNYRRHSRSGVAGLTARNEGKLKSYASCNDVRAWSHDLEARDRYLRDWIKSDMPICVISIATLVSFLRIMTYKNRGKITPRCHPNCKSKVVLESICASCDAMKGCLKNDNTFEKYFEEEEFETCHWPCERCLDALKSIKMFWKVIVEKVFRIRVPKTDESVRVSNVCNESVRGMANAWQSEMVHQAWVVKNLMPCEGDGLKTCQCHPTKSVRLDPRISTRTFTMDDRPRSGHSVRSNLTKLRNDEPIPILVGCRPRRHRNSVHRYISVKVKTVDVGCDTCDLYKENDECSAYVNDLKFLEQRYETLKIEVEMLKRENSSLRFELYNFYKGFSLKSHVCTPAAFSPSSESLYHIPKPFECIEEPGEVPKQPTKNADSEMIITMKNCHNPNFKNVSLLQVLHKSNVPASTNSNETGCRKEDPANLLVRMQDVFGAIMKREINIVSDKKRSRTKLSDIDASFHRVTVSKSVPSCTTPRSASKTSMFHCVSRYDEKCD